MRRLGKIVSRLNKMRTLVDAANANDCGRLEVLSGFGTNPGELDCRVYVPSTVPRALVVVLHGCTQSASVYDRGSGWSKLAERHGFAVLYPQQRRSNNPNLCFNWYVPDDARRGCGEALSISQMVEHLARQWGLNRSSIFVTGLSAGGAMTAVMLACYPELFGSGAIIAGLPFATADTLPAALERMRGQGFPRRQELAVRAEAAASLQLSPPTVSVWHGTHDPIVDPSNSTAIANQWRDLHGVGGAEGRIDSLTGGHRREVWSDTLGRPLVERYDIRGMGHGIPLDTRDSAACGSAGPHMLEANICSTRQIASSWGLIADKARLQPSPALVHADAKPAGAQGSLVPLPPAGGVQAVIEDALRTAGLMR